MTADEHGRTTLDRSEEASLFDLGEDAEEFVAGEERSPDVEEASSEQSEALAAKAQEGAEAALADSLVTLGYVAFDSSSADNASSNLMVSEEHRASFRRDTYVGIADTEQGIEFLGRVVEG